MIRTFRRKRGFYGIVSARLFVRMGVPTNVISTIGTLQKPELRNPRALSLQIKVHRNNLVLKLWNIMVICPSLPYDGHTGLRNSLENLQTPELYKHWAASLQVRFTGAVYLPEDVIHWVMDVVAHNILFTGQGTLQWSGFLKVTELFDTP